MLFPTSHEAAMLANNFSQCVPITGILVSLATLFKKIKLLPKNTFRRYVSPIQEKASYTSINHVVVEGILLPHILPFVIDDEKYLRHNRSKGAALQLTCTVGSLLLQLILIFKWFQSQKLSSSGGVITENWKQILMMFCAVLFIATCFGLLHLQRVSKEVVCVLNCSNYSERKYLEKGTYTCRSELHSHQG